MACARCVGPLGTMSLPASVLVIPIHHNRCFVPHSHDSVWGVQELETRCVADAKQ